MRYYNFALATTTEEIEVKTRVRLKDYSYDNTICAVNTYMYKNLKNNTCFFIYREEENTLLASFAYDDRKDCYQNVYDLITGMLKDAFQIRKIPSEPVDITMYSFLDNILESRRHEYMQGLHRISEISNLWLYEVRNSNTWEDLHYEFREKIIAESSPITCGIYDSCLIEELRNIRTHANSTDLSGNVFHYVISARSQEAAEDITESLMQELIKAKRLSSRRMEIIRGIAPDIYLRANNHIEEILENNTGGVVVFDLTERFGKNPVEYDMAGKYIVKLLKNYRNKCLFVFTYNMDHPGFSFTVLSQIKKFVIPIMLREGTGDRKDAVNYLKGLIGRSEYAGYAKKAGEFLKLFPGNTFSQTDVLNAYAKFDAWCLCTQVMQVPYDISDDFLLDRDENTESAYDRLQSLIGLGIVKKQIDEIITNNLVEKERKLRSDVKFRSSCMHMVFSGNPGSAKTTVAGLFAGIAKEKGILKSGAFVVRSGVDLDGALGAMFIAESFEAAKGGVLFIDEAYAIKHDSAMTVLIQEMENKRDDVIVILAGYNDRMKKFMEQNEGMKSRVPYWVDFPDYTEDELVDIFKLMVKERGFEATADAVERARYIFSKVCCLDNFGNGRYVRNMLENSIRKQSVRLLPKGENTGKIKKKDLFLIDAKDIAEPEEGLLKEREYGTAAKELEQLIGLASAKEIIRKAIASFKMNKMYQDRGIPVNKASYHMVFTGNPGTAKTTVARLFAEILKDERVMPSGYFVEVGRADLVSGYVGKTASLVKSKFKEAQGGVLFIDEAYSLCDDRKNSYGDEAINTIVQEMENNRDKVIVIFAGYPEPMQEFLDRNPGMSSRIAFHVRFEDYSVDELCEITRLMLSKKQMEITDAAMKKLSRIFDTISKDDDYGNGRFVRKLLEEAEMNLALRLEQYKNSEITTRILTTIEEEDIPVLPAAKKKTGIIRIGFSG